MNRTVKVAISLPSDLLDRVDRVRRRRGESRSRYFREAAVAYLAAEGEPRAEEYRRGYEREPETSEEVEAAMATAVPLLSSDPWA
jgi:metal-responsive CopG/Arc/MetJ family transcriptional regulator